MAELKISCLGRRLYEQGVGHYAVRFPNSFVNTSFGFNIHGIMILRHILLEVSLKRIKFAYHQKIDVKVLNCSLKTCLVCCVYYCLVPISFIWLPSGWVCWGEQYPNLAEVEPYNGDMRGDRGDRQSSCLKIGIPILPLVLILFRNLSDYIQWRETHLNLQLEESKVSYDLHHIC
jgi:hypothetical protein